jgi:hypothetical protein
MILAFSFFDSAREIETSISSTDVSCPEKRTTEMRTIIKSARDVMQSTMFASLLTKVAGSMVMLLVSSVQTRTILYPRSNVRKMRL